jgi:hypothetical protein
LLATADGASDRVTFFSSDSALFASPPSGALLAHQARLKKLPALVAAKQAALDAALASGAPAADEVGALCIEQHNLRAELTRMRSEEAPPPDSDLFEVRRSMTLPLGFVSLEGRLYLLQRRRKLPGPVHQHVTVAQVHEYGEFKPSPFA